MANCNFNDISGMKFNMLTAIARSEKKSPRGAVWDCSCECGGFKQVVSSDLKSGNVKSCGCIASSGLKIGQKLRKSISIDHTCPSCSIVFKVKPSRMRKSSYVCCSMACREKYLSNNQEKRGGYKKRTEVERFFDEKSTRLKMSARKRSKDYSDGIDGSFLAKLWEKQKGRCFYTNIEMNFNPKDKLRLVSVDRIDNKVGYLEGNIVLCTYAFNSFKFNLEHQEIVDFVNMIKEAN